MERICQKFDIKSSKRIRGREISPPPGWFIISHRHFSDESRHVEKLHGAWFKISNQEIKRKEPIFRFLKMSPNLRKEEIIIDWEAERFLSENKGRSLHLKIEKAKWFEFPGAVLSDPDPIRRISGLLGMLSLFLGILSIVLTILFAIN